MYEESLLCHAWLRYAVVVPLVAFAAILRLWPLWALGSRLAWLTVYPTVAVAAVIGGFLAGLRATAMTCFTVTFLWSLLGVEPFIKDPTGWPGMVVFVLAGTPIADVVQSMRRSNVRAIKAQAQAEVSAILN